MKKLLFLGGLNPGGAEHQMVIIARLLKQEGYDVTYLCDDNSDFFLKELENVDIPVFRNKENKFISMVKLNIPRNALFVYRVLKKHKYDTVVSFLGEYNFFNCITANCRKTKHRVITAIRNNRDEVFLWRRERFYNRFERYTYRKVSNSESAKIKFARYNPQYADKLTTIYNIVDLPPITSSYTCKKDGKVNIIVPASYRMVKNPIRLLEAVALMTKEERQRLRIDWYGNIKTGSSLYEEMLGFIKDNQMEDAIVLHDATNDIANKINEADMVGLFSTSEGLPNSICEGMMLGKPVIMTKVSDYNVLVDFSNGFLCDAENALSIKESLSLAAKCNEMELKTMGMNSQIKARLLFSKESIIEQWKQIL